MRKRVVQNIAMIEKGQNTGIQRQANERYRRQMGEKSEERKMRGDADHGVLRIAGDGHGRADIGGGGERDQVWSWRSPEAIGDGENDRREDETDRVVHKEGGEKPRREDENYEQLKTGTGDEGNAEGDPVEKSGEMEMGNEDHDPKQEDQSVPVDRLIRLVQ